MAYAGSALSIFHSNPLSCGPVCGELLIFKRNQPFATDTLLTKFLTEELPKIGQVRASEKPFELGITDLDSPFVGVIDLDADVNGRKTVTDFKTSGSSFPEHEVKLSGQLTAYQIAEPDAEQMSLCVLVKTKEPKIEWHVSVRNPDDLFDYLSKAGYVAREIHAGRFYQRPQ